MAMTQIVDFGPEHAAGVAALASKQGYPTYADPEQALRVVTAPGAYGKVAVDADGETVVGFAHVSSNGLQAYLWTIVVAESHRRNGIGKRLVHAAFEATGASRMDLLTVPESAEFYESFSHQMYVGFRLYPDS